MTFDTENVRQMFRTQLVKSTKITVLPEREKEKIKTGRKLRSQQMIMMIFMYLHSQDANR